MLPDCPPPHYRARPFDGRADRAPRRPRRPRALHPHGADRRRSSAFGPTRPPPAGRLPHRGVDDRDRPRRDQRARPGDGDDRRASRSRATGSPATCAASRATARSPRSCRRSRSRGRPIGWLYAACRAMREATTPDFAPAIKVPTLIVVGALDTVVSISAVERACRRRCAPAARWSSPARAARTSDGARPDPRAVLRGLRRVHSGVVRLSRRPASPAPGRAGAGRRSPRRGRRRRPIALPVGDAAAGALDDRDQRDDVVGLQAGLDDDVGMAGGDHAVGVAVAAVAGEAHGLLDAIVGGAVGAARTSPASW